jgi:threonine-phosphate decarboxylase
MKANQLNHGPVPEHGGDVYGIARALGLKVAEVVDFSASINPLGYPPGLATALEAALGEVVHYPDRTCAVLRTELAQFHGLNPDQVLVGNGSTELIYLAVRALGVSRGLIVAPAFSEYEKALRAAGADVAWHLTAEPQAFTLSGPIDPQGADLVFVANPASPSGALLSPDTLEQVVAGLTYAGAYVLVDEAFVDFVEEASLKACLDRYPRLLILRSFTKFFGIPGIRLGYLLGAAAVAARLAAVQEPWSVSTLAQAAGRACLMDMAFMAQTREVVRRERQRFSENLAAVPGLKPFPGAANYLLVKLTAPGWTAARLRARLLRRGLVIRDASNFVGLDERFFRVAVRRREENEHLVAALAEVLGGPASR